MACPSCGADSGHLLGCERSPVKFTPTTLEAPPTGASSLDLDTTRARALAVPIALAASTLLSMTWPGGALLRLLFGMWLHELGHTLAAWSVGMFAVPLPWLTLSSDTRSPVFVVLLLGGLGALAWWLREGDRPARAFAPLGAALVVLLGLLVPLAKAQTWVLFCGDGGALLFGTLLMLGAVLLPDEARLSKGALRWGFVVIGAGAYVDAFATWIRAWRDVAQIPFGRNEGSGLSDASRLVDVHGWTEPFLVRSYLGLGAACFAVLAGVVAWRLISPAPAR
jgi:hypothetical protein